MKLSTRARYALRMMLAVAKHGNGGLVTLGDVSRRTGISRRYLEQLATAMKHASLLRGRAGRGGGYSLTRAPGDVRISEIVEAAIGPINVVECVQEPDVCVKSGACECRWVYERINEGIGPYRRFVVTQQEKLDEARGELVSVESALLRLREKVEKL